MTELAPFLIDIFPHFVSMGVFVTGKTRGLFEPELESHPVRISPVFVARQARHRPVSTAKGIIRLIMLGQQETCRGEPVHCMAFFACTFGIAFGELLLVKIGMTVLALFELQRFSLLGRKVALVTGHHNMLSDQGIAGLGMVKPGFVGQVPPLG